MEVKCDYCGKTFLYKGGIAHYKRNKTHHCSRRCLGMTQRVYKDSITKENKRYNMFMGSKKRAKLKGLEFTIKLEDLPQIPEYCPVLGIEIKSNTTHKPLDTSPSVDRIDPNKGYIPGNVRIISNRANRIKADATIDELRKVLKDYEKAYNNLK